MLNTYTKLNASLVLTSAICLVHCKAGSSVNHSWRLFSSAMGDVAQEELHDFTPTDGNNAHLLVN